MTSRTVLIVVASVIGVVALATMIVLALRSPAIFDPGTPEATAQGYARAVVDRDFDAAVTHLTPELQQECTASDFRNSFVPESVRVILDETSVDGDSAVVDLRIAERGSDLFDGGYGFDVTLSMARRDEVWLIDEAPWPVEFCDEGGP